MIRLILHVFLRKRRFLALTTATLLIIGSFVIPSIVTAGTGGVEGGCGFQTLQNGKTVYLTCSGFNLPMWYSSSTPAFNPGDFPCGWYGNQNCGVEPGDPLNE